MSTIPFTGFGSTPVAGSPLSLVLSIAPPTRLIDGTQNDDAYQILRKHIPQGMDGTMWNDFLHGLAQGDAKNWGTAKLIFDQLFKTSASGTYLDRLCNDDGITRPKNLGISDDNFRKLAIKISNNKITLNSFLQVLEIYYGTEATRAHAYSGIANNTPTNSEPYALTDGDTLSLVIDERDSFIVTFTAADFTNIGAATSLEIANVIDRTLKQYNSKAFSVPQYIPTVGATFVCVYSGSLGLAGSVRITGGRAQNVLQFGNLLSVPFVTPTWTISRYPTSSAPEKLRFSPSPAVDFSTVKIGDYVNVYGTEFLQSNSGTYAITNLTSQYFEVDNLSGTAQSVSQTASADLLFFRAIKNTIQNQSRIATVAATDPSVIEVTLPAISSLVNRTTDNASYFQVPTTVAVTSIARNNTGLVTVTTSVPHNLVSGQNVIIDNAVGSGLNGEFTITYVSSTSFTYTTPEYLITTNSTTGLVTVVTASKGAWLGPYLFDPKQGFGITSISTTLTQDLAQSNSYRQITVANSAAFPDAPGYLIFAFGNTNQIAPVRYLARPSNTTILLDSSFVFPTTVKSGSDVTLLLQKGVFIPQNEYGSAYITASTIGRVSASKTIDDIAGAGLKVIKTIQYPGDRGLGGEGLPANSVSKLSDKVYCWAGDEPDSEIAKAKVS